MNRAGAAIVAYVRAEPCLVMGAVQSAIGLGTAFGLGLSAGQVGAIMLATQWALSLACRRMVTPIAAAPAPLAPR